MIEAKNDHRFAKSEITNHNPQSPAAGQPDGCLWDKDDLARFLGLTKRSVDNLMARGCPHLKIGKRRVRFEPAEVRAWCHREFSTRRNGPAIGVH